MFDERIRNLQGLGLRTLFSHSVSQPGTTEVIGYNILVFDPRTGRAFLGFGKEYSAAVDDIFNQLVNQQINKEDNENAAVQLKEVQTVVLEVFGDSTTPETVAAVLRTRLKGSPTHKVFAVVKKFITSQRITRGNQVLDRDPSAVTKLFNELIENV